MLILKSIKEIQEYLSKKIKDERLVQNLTQKELALKANIPLATFRRFEQKGEGSIKDFIKILVALGRVNELENILKQSEYSPIKEYEKAQKEKTKKRVRHATKG